MRQVHCAGLDLPAATDTSHATLSIREATTTKIIDVLHTALSYLMLAYTAGLETAAAIGLHAPTGSTIRRLPKGVYLAKQGIYAFPRKQARAFVTSDKVFQLGQHCLN